MTYDHGGDDDGMQCILGTLYGQALCLLNISHPVICLYPHNNPRNTPYYFLPWSGGVSCGLQQLRDRDSWVTCSCFLHRQTFRPR